MNPETNAPPRLTIHDDPVRGLRAVLDAVRREVRVYYLSAEGTAYGSAIARRGLVPIDVLTADRLERAAKSHLEAADVRAVIAGVYASRADVLREDEDRAAREARAERVEALAKELHTAALGSAATWWDDVPETAKRSYRRQAELVLAREESTNDDA